MRLALVWLVVLTALAQAEPAIRITAAEATSRRLPAVGLEASPSTRWHVTRFPEGGVYVRASGPPGGPLVFEVRRCADDAGLRTAVQSAYGNVNWGAESKVHRAGRPWPAVGFVTGSSMSRTQWLAVQMKPQPGRCILLCFGVASSNPPSDGHNTLTHPHLEPLYRSFKLLP